MTAKKDTVTVELPRSVAERCAADDMLRPGSLRHVCPSDVSAACRAALEAEKVAEREAWVEERDRLLSGWVQQKEEVEDRNGRLVAATYGSADDRAVRATFITSAPDMARLLERCMESETHPPVSQIAALLRSNTWLPPEGE